MKPNQISIDLHGYSSYDALMTFENDLLVAGFLSEDDDYVIDLVTGQGEIKKHILEYCRMQNIYCKEKLSNSGALIILPNQDWDSNA